MEMSGTNNSDRERARVPTGKHLHYYEVGGFDFSLPRPPALGEERVARAPPEHGPFLLSSDAPSTSDKPKPLELYDDCGIMSQPAPRTSPPACLAWAHSLRNLLQDQDGVDLFVRYLESEGPQHAKALHFWFACEGLRKCPLDNVKKLVKLIHKTYFMKSTLPINDELKREITKNLKSSQCLDPPITLFDEAQAQIERLINNTTYPNFLKSDMYLQYLQSIQNPSSDDPSSGDSSSSSSLSNMRDIPNLVGGSTIGPLPTLHENKMYITEQANPLVTTPGSVSTGHHTPTTVSSSLRLTKNMLWRSQNHRALDIPPKSEPYASLFVVRNGAGAHAAYNSYNPVSRQDSEMQSLSSHSDVRTESDSMSLSDYATESRGSSSRARHHHRKTSHEAAKHAKDLASLNRESNMHQVFIPRMLRSDAVRNCPPMDVQQHAAILTAKLEIVKRQQETQDLLHKKLKESDSMSSLEDRGRPCVQGRELDAKFKQQQPPPPPPQMDDDDQDILDEHVNRVFSDPETFSSRPLSPHGGAGVGVGHLRVRMRKDRDGFSTFSGDSGNVHDFGESMIKSKSVPEHMIVGQQQQQQRRSSKKALTDLTDSGVSVVSGTPSAGGGGAAKDYRVVIDWLIKSDRGGMGGGARGAGGTHSEMAGAATASGRRRRLSSRSNSLERKSVCGGLGPAQPFVADPCMPPPPHPNIEIQLEEARRRLEEDAIAKTRTKFNKSLGNRSQEVVVCPSGQSTLRKSTRLQRPCVVVTSTDDAVTTTTTTVFAFCDEQFPYRIKIPGTQVTLKQFKEYLPKKGNYRFFFKTVCEDLGNQVTHEEITNDSEVLPLWEGKIMAQVKAID